MLTSGFMLEACGVGTLFSMMLVGRLLNKGVDPRGSMLVGWSIATYALWRMSGWNAETPGSLIIVTSVTQGAGLGLVFVPLQTVGYATLPAKLRTRGAAMIANLVNNTAVFHSRLVEYVTPFSDAMKLPDAMGKFSLTTDRGSPPSMGS